MTLHLTLRRKFTSLYAPLTVLLDQIKATSGQGTAAAATAYSDAYSGNPTKQVTGASPTITAYVKTLAATEVDYFSGLGFTDPHDDAKKRQDIVNSLLASWDASAAKYLNGKVSDGDAARPTLQKRLQEFETTFETAGKTAVTPDK